MGQKIYVRSRTGGNYRRAGFTWTGAWAEVDVADLSKEQKALIKTDAHLQIREKPPEEFAAPKEAPGFDPGEVARPADLKALEAENAALLNALEEARQASHSVDAQVRASVAEAAGERDHLKKTLEKANEAHAAELADRDAQIAKLVETVASLEASARKADESAAALAKAVEGATPKATEAKADEAKSKSAKG